MLQEGAAAVSRLDAAGRETQRFEDAVALSGDARTVLVRHRDGRLRVISGTGGALLAELPTLLDARGDLPLRDAEGALVAAARLTSEGLRLHWLDAPEVPQEVALVAPATRLAGDPLGRFIIAWDPEGGPASIVDVARGRSVQAVAGEGAAIADVLLTDSAAYLMLRDQSMVGAISLAAIRPEAEAPIRRIPLGQPSAVPVEGRGLLAALTPRPHVLAVHAGNQTGFLLHPTSTIGHGPLRRGLRRRAAVALARRLARRHGRTDGGLWSAARAAGGA